MTLRGERERGCLGSKRIIFEIQFLNVCVFVCRTRICMRVCASVQRGNERGWKRERGGGGVQYSAAAYKEHPATSAAVDLLRNVLSLSFTAGTSRPSPSP